MNSQEPSDRSAEFAEIGRLTKRVELFRAARDLADATPDMPDNDRCAMRVAFMNAQTALEAAVAKLPPETPPELDEIRRLTRQVQQLRAQTSVAAATPEVLGDAVNALGAALDKFLGATPPADPGKTLIIDVPGMPDEVVKRLNADGILTVAKFAEWCGPQYDVRSLSREFGLTHDEVRRAHAAFKAFMPPPLGCRGTGSPG